MRIRFHIYKPYLLLWGIAGFITFGMLLYETYGINPKQKKILKPGLDPSEVHNETIDDLLLTSKDLSGIELYSFTNLFLKSKANTPASTTAVNYEVVYNKIFQKKIAGIKKKSAEPDFSIKPVPK